ncbi:MAG: PAS domain-containing protein [Nevskia sp.]|nr:PAS domain-containing protein [Nevskia sp.]
MVPSGMVNTWQNLVDIMAQVIGVPSALITRLDGDRIEVLVGSETERNPYRPGQRRHPRGSGLYCEAVISGKQELHVEDALADPRWSGNPDLRFNLVSYLGYPILWPDRRPFGTICVLDVKRNDFPDAHRRLIHQFCYTIQNHLEMIYGEARRFATAGNTPYDRLLSFLPNMVYELRVDPDGGARKVLYCSERGAAFFGLDISSPTLGADFLGMIHPDDRDRLDGYLMECALARQPYQSQFRLVLPGGRLRWVDSRSEPEPDGTGRVLFRGVLTDITALKETEEELRLQQQRLKLATEVSGMGVWEMDIASGVSVWNDRMLEIFGIEQDQFDGRSKEWEKLIHPEDRGWVFDAVHRMTEGRNTNTGDRPLPVRIVTPAGEIKWVKGVSGVICDEQGRPVRAIGTALDVTEGHLLVRRLEQSHAALKQAERLARIGSWTWDVAKDHFIWSDMLYEILQWSPADPTPNFEGLQRILTPASFALARATMERCLQSGEAASVDLDAVRTDGEPVFVNAKVQVARDAGGVVTGLFGTVHDITELKQKERYIRSLNERIQLAVKAGGVGIWDMDFSTGRFIWDEQMHALYGRKPGELRGELEEWHAAVHPDDVERASAGWDLSVNATSVFNDEFRIVLPSGELRHIRGQARVFRHPDGSPARALGVNWDVTAERQAAEALHKAKLAAEAAERAKGRFLAIVSHEIRTPMNAVLGMTRLALGTELDTRQRGYLEKIDRSAKALLAIINDVLDLSKIEEGRIELEETRFTLQSVIESVSAVTAIKAEEKGLHLGWTVQPGVAGAWIGDPLRLGQVLINLVSNAVKFTDAGEVAVSIALEPEAETETSPCRTLRFDVRDTGIGLEPGQIERLFQAFSQADSDTSRRYGGTGLGLFICKQLVELMGGSIRVESKPGQGSTFSFTVRVQPAQASGAGPRDEDAPIPELARLAGRRVLVVDDDELNREVAAGFLLAAGLLVDTAVDGVDALDILDRADARFYDAVLLDLQMPRMDGVATARAIRQRQQWSRLPLLALTAHLPEQSRQAALAAGIDACLTKPIDESVLYRTLLQLLPGEAPQTHRPPPAADAAEDLALPAILPGVDLSAALARVNGDQAFLAGLLRRFAQNHAPSAAQLVDDYQSGRREAQAALAHRLVSSAFYLGADGLAGAAAELEAVVRRNGTDDELAECSMQLHNRLDDLVRGLDAWLARGRRSVPSARESDRGASASGAVSKVAQAAVEAAATAQARGS